jgi:hypothetical protein
VDGRLAPEFIEQQAVSYRDALLGDAGSKFKARNLTTI